MMDFPEYCWNGQVRYGEAGPDGRARLGSVANWFQEAAAINADDLGFGSTAMSSHGIGWVLARMLMQVAGLPPVGAAVQVRTWPSVGGRMYYRGYELKDESGQILVKAASAWVLMDMETRKMVSMPRELVPFYPVKTYDVLPFPRKTLPRVPEQFGETPVLVRADDVDMNGHVNNAHYISWLNAACGGVSGRFSLDVQFRMETFPGERLQVRWADMPEDGSGNAAPGRILAIARDDADVCRAVMTSAS